MKTTTLLLAAMAALVGAQRIRDALPECAADCLEDGISNATDCDLDDGDCVCEVDNYRNTYDASQACVLQACGAARSLGTSSTLADSLPARIVLLMMIRQMRSSRLPRDSAAR